MNIQANRAPSRYRGCTTVSGPSDWRRSILIFFLGAFSAVIACKSWDHVPAGPASHNRILGLRGPQLTEPAASSSTMGPLRHSISYQNSGRVQPAPLVLKGVSGEVLPGMPLKHSGAAASESLTSLFGKAGDQPRTAMHAGDTITLKSGAGPAVSFKITARRPACTAADPAKAPVSDVNLVDCVPGDKAGAWQYVIEAVTVPVAAPAVQQSL
jgi:hypothetical protein